MKSIGVRALQHIERLVRRGRLAPSTGDLLELGPPLTPMRRASRPSAVLRRARSRER